MPISLLDNLLWICGFLANVALLRVLIAKKRFDRFPIFVAYTTFHVVRTMSLFGIREVIGDLAYFWTYLSFEILDYLLQVATIAEIGNIVLKPYAAAIADAKSRILIWSGLSLAIAAGLCRLLSPPAVTGYELWDMRVSLFTSLLTCQSFLAITTLINRLRIRRSNHVLAIGRGLAIWSAVSVMGDVVHAVSGWNSVFAPYDQIRIFVYVAATVYWCFAFQSEERRDESIDSDRVVAAIQSVNGVESEMDVRDTRRKAS